MQIALWPVNELSSRWMVLVSAPIVGSFLGVVIQRLPQGQSVTFARSACEHCGTRLAAWELIPLVSYAWQGGKCRTCHEMIPWFHPLIELAAIAVALSALAADPDASRLWVDCALGWSLLALGWIDAGWLLLPDVLTLPLVPIGLLVTLLWQPAVLADHIVATFAGYLGLRGVAWVYRALRGFDGVGDGDAKLLAAVGAWLGLAALPIVVLIAALFGLALAAAQALTGHQPQATTAMPFGSCLAVAMWLIWLYGGAIAGALSWSLGWLWL